MKKKVMYSLVLVLFSLFLLAGCKKNVGTSEDNAVVDEENQTEEISYDYTFGFTCIDMSNPYYDTLEKSIETELEKVGCSLMTRDPALNVETQIQQIQEMIDAGVDAVFLCPVDWEAIQPAIDALNEAEIPIINIDTQIKDVESITAYVGSDNKNAGYVCGENLIELKPDGGKVVILESPSMNSVNERITDLKRQLPEKDLRLSQDMTPKEIWNSPDRQWRKSWPSIQTLTQSCAGMISPRWGHWFPLGLLKETIS